MKRWLSVIGIVAGIAVVSVRPGLAQGLNLSWDDCAAFGSVNKSIPCNVSSGINTMYASFSAPPNMDKFLGVEVVLDVKSSTDPLPDWWRMRNQVADGQINQCRQGALTVGADFTANTNCADVFAGSAAGGIGTYRVGGPAPMADLSRVRLTMAFALAAGNEVPLTAGTEYYAVKVNISNAKTTGAGACAGCTTPMSVTLNGIKVAQPNGSPGGDVWVTAPLVNRTVTWQGGLGAPPLSTGSTTWGQVKSLYR